MSLLPKFLYAPVLKFNKLFFSTLPSKKATQESNTMNRDKLKYKALRLVIKLSGKREFIIVSGGGVATTTLVNFFGVPNYYKHYLDYYKHYRWPPLDPRISRAIFVTGDPVTQIQYIFNQEPSRRNEWQRHHCYKMFGDYEKINRDWSLSDYLENGEDIFQLECQFDKWTGNSHARSPYPILIVKYDSIWENLPAIFEFLNWNLQLINQFPAKRERSTYPPLSARDKENMEKLYGRLREKYVAAPEIFIRPGSY